MKSGENIEPNGGTSGVQEIDEWTQTKLRFHTQYRGVGGRQNSLYYEKIVKVRVKLPLCLTN